MFVSKFMPRPLRRAARRGWLFPWAAVFLLGLASASLSALAQPYPARAVTLVVPFIAGGATDVVARLLAEQLTSRMGQSFVVENRAGANGAIGSAAVAKAAPDGHMLVMGGVNTHAMNDSMMKSPLYNSVADFTPVALVARIPIVIVAHASLDVASLADLVALAKSQPGTLSYGSSGAGGPQHLAMEMFKARAGLDIRHVAYRGGAPQLNDLIGGHIKIGAIGLPPVLQHVQAGSLKALAMVEMSHSALLPSVPTIAESGYPGFDVSYWMGVLAPARTPEPIVRVLHAAIMTVLAKPDIQSAMKTQGAEVLTGTPEDFAALIAAEAPRWAEIVGRIGMKLDN